MKKREFLKLVQNRLTETDKRITQNDIDRVLTALVDVCNDIVEHSMFEDKEYVKLTKKAMITLRTKPEKVMRATKLRNIATGEAIDVPEHITPMKRIITLDGIEY